MMIKDIDKQMQIIRRGSVEIISEPELREKIESSIKSNRPLVVKAGFDPTAPDIHLGHTVLLRKLRHFQELGHKIIFLIGDFTAIIGDPSGQTQTRKTLTFDEVNKNVKTYIEQVGKILDVSNKKVFEIRYNSQWFGRGTTSATMVLTEFLISIAAKYTVARLIERDDFAQRLKENKPITVLELLYPLMQGYDSVVLKADVELGGTDQKFNLLVGRDIQSSYGQKPQVVITMPLLEGTDGVQKMSKSYGNYIGINELAKDMFGKIMSISDELMLKYYELLTDGDVDKIRTDIKSGKLHPKDAKKILAKIIVKQYHGEKEAIKQEGEFERAFKDKDFPQDIEREEKRLEEKAYRLKADKFGKNYWTVPVVYILAEAFISLSRSEARRKIKEGAVEINGQKVMDITAEVPADHEHKIRVGKQFRRVFVIPPGK